MDQSRYLPPNEVDATSSRLLKRLSEDDPEAWEQFVRVYGPVVRFWIRRKGLNKTDLADVFQEVFLAASRNITSFDRHPGQAKFRAWLKTITVSKVNDHFRRHGKHPAAKGGTTMMQRIDALPEAEDLNEKTTEESLICQRTLEMVKGEFREKTWQAFYRCAVDGQTSQEVAAELGISALAVRKAKSRVLARLRDALANLDGGDSATTEK